jgi:hypothetical protein
MSVDNMDIIQPFSKMSSTFFKFFKIFFRGGTSSLP